MELIVAPATPSAEGAIGIVRLSGPGAWALVGKLFRSDRDPARFPRTLILGDFTFENWHDRALCVCYKAPFSYTGEEMAELQLHGSPALVGAATRACLALGARMAQPGEFTRRAYLNGKLDFSAAEGVLALIRAQSEAGANAAYRLLSGDANRGLRQAEATLRSAAAALAGAMDYPDEMEADARLLAKEGAEKALETAQKALSGVDPRYYASGAYVVLCGLPNAGKSSLMNALLQRDRAIVTPIPGTTRDTLEDTVSVAGFPVRLADTAGIREGGDEVERLGVARARRAAEGADLILFLSDLSTPESEPERALLATLAPEKVLKVGTKADLKGGRQAQGIAVSALTGQGLAELKDAIADRLKLNAGDGGVTGLRQADCLKRAAEALERLLGHFDALTLDCVYAETEEALTAFAEATGSEVSEAVVDELFRQFCVGK